MDKNAITVDDVVELALIELQYMAADFSQRRESTSDPLERAALDIQLPNIRMAMVAIEFTLEAIRIPSDRSEHLQGRPYGAATSPAQTIAPRSFLAIVSFPRFACVRSA